MRGNPDEAQVGKLLRAEEELPETAGSRCGGMACSKAAMRDSQAIWCWWGSY